jgi:hypothetical protein
MSIFLFWWVLHPGKNVVIVMMMLHLELTCFSIWKGLAYHSTHMCWFSSVLRLNLGSVPLILCSVWMICLKALLQHYKFFLGWTLLYALLAKFDWYEVDYLWLVCILYHLTVMWLFWLHKLWKIAKNGTIWLAPNLLFSASRTLVT